MKEGLDSTESGPTDQNEASSNRCELNGAVGWEDGGLVLGLVVGPVSGVGPSVGPGLGLGGWRRLELVCTIPVASAGCTELVRASAASRVRVRSRRRVHSLDGSRLWTWNWPPSSWL